MTRTCTDNAGNVGTDTKPFKYDATNPVVTVAAGRVPDHNGWYNAPVTFSASATDATSLVASCQADVNYSGPDDGSASVTRTCTDNAGNVGTDTKPLKYDATNPVVTVAAGRVPDHNGWYNAPVTFSASATDATSLVASCQADVNYSGPDDGSASVTRTCTDNAGNVGTDTKPLKYDSTKPLVSVSLARAADHNGWYNAPVGYSITSKSDATSGIDLATCDSGKTYSTPDSATAVTDALSCTDNAGNTAFDSVSFKYDNTNPTLTVALARASDHNGWYNHAVGYGISAKADATSGIDSCEADATYSTPDSSTASVTRSCTDVAGNTAFDSVSFQYDNTNPTLTVALARASDHNGWYNHAVGYGSSAKADATSGIDSCEADATYSTPDSSTASVTRSCTDVAGNVGTDTKTFQYDSTKPVVAVSLARIADHNGWYNAPVGYSITTKTDATSGIDPATCDAGKTYSTPDSATAQTDPLGCSDYAGNSATDKVTFQYDNTKPVVAVSLARIADHNGWYNAPVGYSITTKTDATSGIDPATCDAGKTYSTPDSATAQTDPLGCSDYAGNSATDKVTFKYDATAPGISFSGQSPVKNTFGWNKTDVTLSWACTDALSAPVATSVSKVISTEGSDQQATGTCSDNAGNTTSSTDGHVYLDKTLPTLNIVGAASGATFGVCTLPTRPTYNPADNVSGSGLDGTQGDTWVTPTTTSGVGTYTYTAHATDKAGNGVTETRTYTTTYGNATVAAVPFLQPINNDGSSRFKMGSTVPVKFQATCNGVAVPTVVAKMFVKQGDSQPDPGVDEAVSTSAATTGNLFRWTGSPDNQYIFNLSTKLGYGNPDGTNITSFTQGTWTLKIGLDDGTFRSVNVQLVK